MILAHAGAVLARLRENPDLETRVFDAAVPLVDGKPRTRYVRVFSNTGRRSQERFTGKQTRADFTFVIHSVSLTANDALGLSEKVIAQLLDFVPNVDGRVCRRLRHVVSRPVNQDRDTTPPLYYVVDEFDLTSSPARPNP